MNILYICPRFPYPPTQGDKVVIYNQIKFLSRNHKIALLTLIDDEKELEGLSNLSCYCTRIETFKKRPNFSISNFIMALFKKDPFTVIRYYSPEMLERSKRLIESAAFDIIHVSQYYMGQYAVNKDIRIPQKTAAIFDTHHVQYLVLLEFAKVVRNPFVKLLATLEASRVKNYELPMYKKFDKCIAVNKLDEDTIKSLSGAANIAVNPFCMEMSVDLGGAVEEEQNAIIFFGTLKALPNSDGLKFFYEEIFPLIKKEIPNVKLIIAGTGLDKFGIDFTKDSNIRLAGVITNIRDFLKKVAVVVVPLRVIGGGITIKILDAWAAGKAVVSTSRAAEGIQTTDGVDIIIADSAADFAKEVIGLLKDKAKREAMGKAALRKLEECYSPGRIIENLERIYRKALEQKGLNVKE